MRAQDYTWAALNQNRQVDPAFVVVASARWRWEVDCSAYSRRIA
jgi:hypothetical protein